MTPTSIPSACPTCSVAPPSSPFCFPTNIPSPRFYGHSPCGSRAWQSYLSSSCYKGPGKPKQSQHITSLPSASTALSTFRTGSTDILQKITLTQSPSSRGSFRPSCTRTSSGSITQSASQSPSHDKPSANAIQTGSSRARASSFPSKLSTKYSWLQLLISDKRRVSDDDGCWQQPVTL